MTEHIITEGLLKEIHNDLTVFREDEQKSWIVVSITTRCPKCGSEKTDEGDEAEYYFGAIITCLECGFEGELPG